MGLIINPYIYAVAGGTWLPTDLANLYAWYDADQQTEADLGGIATLVDQSGNGRNFTHLGSNQPLLKHSFVNGHHAVQLGENAAGAFQATRLDIGNTFLASPTAAMMFYVCKAFADPSVTNRDGAVFGQIENHTGDTHIPYTDSNIYTGFCSTTRRSVNPAFGLTNWHIFAEHSATNDYAIWINGSTILTSGTNTVGTSTNARRFGCGDASAVAAYRGQCAEAIFVNAIPSTLDRQKVEGYLAHKYGLTGLLPGGHPYISSPP